jgi:hypothetical protein
MINPSSHRAGGRSSIISSILSMVLSHPQVITELPIMHAIKAFIMASTVPKHLGHYRKFIVRISTVHYSFLYAAQLPIPTPFPRAIANIRNKKRKLHNHCEDEKLMSSHQLPPNPFLDQAIMVEKSIHKCIGRGEDAYYCRKCPTDYSWPLMRVVSSRIQGENS